MKRLFPIVVLLSVLACNGEEAGTENQSLQPGPVQMQEPGILTADIYLDDNLLQQVEETVKGGAPATKAAAFGRLPEGITVFSMERVFPEAGEFEARHREAGLHRWYTISYKADVSATKAGSSVADIPGVQLVLARRRARIHGTPFFDDGYFSRQWNMLNDGSLAGSVPGADVNVLPVWQSLTTGDPGVVVAIVDSGVDVLHEDLGARVDVAGSWNFVDNTGDIQPGNHGTHVGGTIAAVSINGKGIAGIAGGDAAAGKAGTTLISCQIFSADGGGGLAMEAALVWAADHGAVIANNSWGYEYTDSKGKYMEEIAKEDYEFFLQPNEGEYANPLKSAVDYFNRNAGMDLSGRQTGPMAGGVVFFSAGNDASPFAAPAPYEGIVAVGSVAPDGRAASYSNYGEWVDIAAPGGDFAFGEEGLILGCAAGNLYAYSEGTSMACPHVSGVAALIVAACGGPGFTREMLLEKLLNGTSRRIDPSGQGVGPMVDAWNAVNYGDMTPPAGVSTLTVSARSNTLTAQWEVTGHDRIPAAGFLVLYSASREDLEASTPTGKKESVFEALYTVSTEKTGEEVSLTLRDLEFETDYFVKVYAFNGNGVFSDASAIVSARTRQNHGPAVIKPFQNVLLTSAAASFKLSLPDFFVDEDADMLSYTATSSSPSSVHVTTGGETLTGTAVGSGLATVEVKATDPFGKFASATFKVAVRTGSEEVSAYPNPVVDRLFITNREHDTQSMSVRLLSATGAPVFEETVSGSAFEPAVVDLSGLAPGVYSATITFGSKEYKQTIVKK